MCINLFFKFVYVIYMYVKITQTQLDNPYFPSGWLTCDLFWETLRTADLMTSVVEFTSDKI